MSLKITIFPDVTIIMSLCSAHLFGEVDLSISAAIEKLFVSPWCLRFLKIKRHGTREAS